MGLDFSLYKLRKGETMDNLWNMPYEEQEKRSLAYARKGWELVYALHCDTSGDCISQLKLEDWVDLMDKMAQIGDYFNDIRDAYHTIDAIEDDYDTVAELRSAYPREMKLTETYRIWYNKNFDTPPTLGYEFSVGYMLNFWEAADEVLKYLEDPDWEVWMIASY